MRKIVFSMLLTAFALFALSSCEPEDPLAHLTDGVKVTTADPNYITGCTALCGAEVTADDAGLLIELGVCCGLTENPTIDDRVVKSHKCSQPFLGMLTNLEPNTEYHVRGYAKYGTEYCYGDERTFTTLSSDSLAATPVTTMPAYDIGYDLMYGEERCYFFCKVIVMPFGVSNWSMIGVCYGTSPDLNVNNSPWAITYQEDGENIAYCYGLQMNTTYYYRAFVSFYDDNGQINYFYGNILSLTTPDTPLLLDVSTEGSYYIPWDLDILASGYMSCNKIGVVDQVGFCYSTTNPYPEFESDTHISAGTPTGTWDHFESHISASNGGITLNTTYYIRAYARYMNDSIKYGNVEAIDTY